MTDKEQIMIDGVDVSGCEKYPLSNKWHGSIIFCKGGCNAYPNCEFKQLARKTQECAELKERLERTEEDLKYQCVDCMNVKSDRYRKALDEIEEYTKTTLRMPLERRVILDIINKAGGNGYEIL